MIVTSIKTKRILPFKKNLFEILDVYVKDIQERSVLAITSKIVSICEGNVIKIGDVDKIDLIKQEAELYIPPEENAYNIALTVKQSLLIPSAGIDESNSSGYYVLWPKDSQKTANRVRKYLCKRFSRKYVGVVITDSRTTPLRWGTTGVAIAHSGFAPLNDYIDTPDIFGRQLKVTKVNVMDSLGGIAVTVMGEGKEQTPLAIIEDVPFVTFLTKNPSKKEIDGLRIDIEEDVFGNILKNARWKKGGSSS